MNILINLSLLFGYIFGMLYFKLPDVMNNNYLFQKFCLFIGIFGFYYIGHSVQYFVDKSIKSHYDLLQKTLNMSLFCVLGYSIYVDMLHMDKTQGFFGDIATVTPIKRYLGITFIIVAFVALIEIIKMVI